MQPVSHSQVLAAVAEQIEAIDAAPFRQGGLAESFTEALNPFGPEDQADAIAHLGFAVFLRTAPIGQSRQQSGKDIEIDAEVDVLFTYRLRPTEQVTDYRGALDASEAIIRRLIPTDWMPEVAATVREAAEVRQLLDEPWLFVRVGFEMNYEIRG